MGSQVDPDSDPALSGGNPNPEELSGGEGVYRTQNLKFTTASAG